jgi:hypothetical protein
MAAQQQTAMEGDLEQLARSWATMRSSRPIWSIGGQVR